MRTVHSGPALSSWLLPLAGPSYSSFLICSETIMVDEAIFIYSLQFYFQFLFWVSLSCHGGPGECLVKRSCVRCLGRAYSFFSSSSFPFSFLLFLLVHPLMAFPLCLEHIATHIKWILNWFLFLLTESLSEGVMLFTPKLWWIDLDQNSWGLGTW